MRPTKQLRRDLTRWSLLCILFVAIPVSSAWGQAGNGGGGNDGKPRMEVWVDAAQYGSADMAIFMLDWQFWWPSALKDSGARGAAGVYTFRVRLGFSGPLELLPIEAINPDDGTVSLAWNIWSEDPVQIDDALHPATSPISGGSGNVQLPSWQVNVPTFKGTLTPEDNFTGRSLSKYGVGEVVLLSMTTDPAISTAGHVFFWELAPGSQGTLSSADTQGNAIYTAPASPCEVELVLKYTDSADVSHVIELHTLQIIEPSGAYMVQKPGSNIKHTNGFWDVGFHGHFFLLPTDVSFKNIQFREGTVPAVATGWLAHWNNQVHATGVAVSVSQGNSTTGCQVLGQDQVYSGRKAPPFGNGTFHWPIPWEHRVNNSA